MGILQTDILAEHTVTMSTVRLEYPLQKRQIGDFRKMINSFVGADNDLFHNHQTPTKYHYRYPLVQYKTLDRKAALVGIGDRGAEAMDILLSDPDFRERCERWIGEQFAVTETSTEVLTLHTTPVHRYRLRQYLALNEKNIDEWKARPGLLARTALLERCLAAHILKFASAIHWQLPARSLQVSVLDFRDYATTLYGTPFLAFDVFFQTNITLPEAVGLGKAASHGYGVCHACPPNHRT